MDKDLRKLVFIFVILNLSLILFAVVYTVAVKSLEGTENEIKCVVQQTLHIYCPGCGGSRSLRALLSFDFLKSFTLYPPILISAVAVLDYDVRLLVALLKKKASLISSYKFKIFLIIPISIILTFLVRNLLLLGFGIDTVGDIIK